MGTNPSTPRTPDDARLILDSIRRLVQGLRLASRAAQSRLGLSGAQLFVLQKLGDETTMSVNDLAERTCTHQSSVSVVVQRLVERRLVKRQPAAADRRRVELSLTPAGRKLLAKSPAATQERLLDSLIAMPPAARKQLATRLDDLIQGMGLDRHPAPMFFEENARRPRQ